MFGKLILPVTPSGEPFLDRQVSLNHGPQASFEGYIWSFSWIFLVLSDYCEAVYQAWKDYQWIN